MAASVYTAAQSATQLECSSQQSLLFHTHVLFISMDMFKILKKKVLFLPNKQQRPLFRKQQLLTLKYRQCVRCNRWKLWVCSNPDQPFQTLSRNRNMSVMHEGTKKITVQSHEKKSSRKNNHECICILSNNEKHFLTSSGVRYYCQG